MDEKRKCGICGNEVEYYAEYGCQKCFCLRSCSVDPMSLSSPCGWCALGPSHQPKEIRIHVMAMVTRLKKEYSESQLMKVCRGGIRDGFKILKEELKKLKERASHGKQNSRN
jgi:hypothetical protein